MKMAWLNAVEFPQNGFGRVFRWNLPQTDSLEGEAAFGGGRTDASKPASSSRARISSASGRERRVAISSPHVLVLVS